MTDLNSLLERVQGATGSDRELDARLWCLGEGVKFSHLSSQHEAIIFFRPGQNGSCREDNWVPFTTSLDAALALVERARPGWTHDLTWWPPSDAETGHTRCTLGGPGYISDETTTDTFEVTLEGDSPKHALALIAALLKSLIGGEGE